jgi:hypothetical protein
MKEKEDDKTKPNDHKVHVVAVYTMTAAEARFVAEQDATVRQVIDEAYAKLKEARRPTDQHFCHAEPRVDLAPHMDATLKELNERGGCISIDHGQKLTFELDIDAEPGGAA